MFAYERRNQIVELVNKLGSVTVQELVNRYEVSLESIRKDLSYLEKENQLKRVHGGAVALSKMKTFRQLNERIDQHKERKITLAKRAVSFISDRDMIAIDSGSTAAALIPFLAELPFSLTIVTHSLAVFSQLKDHPRHKVLLIGGQYLKEEAAFYGNLALDSIENLHVSKAFICPSAVSITHGISDYEPHLILIQKSYIAHADEVYVLADSTKFEKNALMRICDIGVPNAIVTDDRLDPGVLELYQKNHIRILN